MHPRSSPRGHRERVTNTPRGRSKRGGSDAVRNGAAGSRRSGCSTASRTAERASRTAAVPSARSVTGPSAVRRGKRCRGRPGRLLYPARGGRAPHALPRGRPPTPGQEDLHELLGPQPAEGGPVPQVRVPRPPGEVEGAVGEDPVVYRLAGRSDDRAGRSPTNRRPWPCSLATW